MFGVQSLYFDQPHIVFCGRTNSHTPAVGCKPLESVKFGIKSDSVNSLGKAMNFKTMQVVASSLQGNTPDVKDLMRKQKKCLFERYVFLKFVRTAVG